MSDVTKDLKKLYPTAYEWYVKDPSDVIDEKAPKEELDEMITYLIELLDDNTW